MTSPAAMLKPNKIENADIKINVALVLIDSPGLLNNLTIQIFKATDVIAIPIVRAKVLPASPSALLIIAKASIRTINDEPLGILLPFLLLGKNY